MAKSRWNKFLNTLQVRRDYSETPAGLEWRSNTFFIISTITAAMFSDLFLYGLIVPVMPFMLRDRIGIPQDGLQNHFSALLAVNAGASMLFSPVAGYLADKMTTRQAPFLIGLVMLMAATLMLFLGQSLAVLYLARILQGISGGFVWTIGLALCLETVGRDNFGTTIGTVFSFIGTGSIIAPLVGGVLYEKVGYSGVFLVGCGILAVDFIMRILVIEKKTASQYRAEQDASDAGPGPDGQSNRENNGEEQRDGQNADGERQPLLGQKEDDEAYKISDDLPAIARAFPILPCLLDPRLATAFFVGLVQAFLYGSFDATIPLVAQELFGFKSLNTGLLFLPLGVMDLLFGPAFGWAVDRFGTKVVAVGAYVWLIPTHLLLRLPQAGGRDQIILYGALLGLSGIGLAGINAPSIVESGAIIERYYKANPDFFGERGPYAQLYGMNNMIFCLGLTVGPELAGQLKTLIGYGNMNIVLAVLCAFTALLSFIYLGGKVELKRKGKDGT